MSKAAMNIKSLNAQAHNFWSELDAMLAWESVSDEKVLTVVNDIIKNVRQRGDDAVVEYTNRFDRMQVTSIQQLELSQEKLQQALQRIPAQQRAALDLRGIVMLTMQGLRTKNQVRKGQIEQRFNVAQRPCSRLGRLCPGGRRHRGSPHGR